MHCGCSGHQAEEALHSLQMVVACEFLTVVLQQVFWSKNPQPHICASPIYKGVSLSKYVHPNKQ